MMGLLDGNLDDPKTQALLSLGFGLLNSRGNFGQGLGQAGAQSMATYTDARRQQQQRAMQAQQMAMLKAQEQNTIQQEALRKQQEQRELQKQAMLARIMGGGQPGSAQMPVAEQAPQAGQMQGQAGPMAGQPQRGSALSGMTEDQIIAGIALGLPEKAYDAWKFAKVGEQMQPGYQRMPDGTTRYNPDPTKGVTLGPNGSVQQMPGAAAALSGLAGASAGATTAAQEEAKAPYNFIDAYVDGRPGKVPVSSLVAKNPLSRQDMRLDVADPSTQYSSPAVRAAVEKAAGGPAGFVQTGPSRSDKATAETTSDVNKDWLGTSYKPVVEAGNAAKSVLTSIGVARNGLALAGPSGWGKEATVAAARVLGALGVERADQMASGAQIFQQAASTRLWEVLNSAKGPQTEGDATRAQNTFAKLGNTVRANNFILDLAQATAERDARKAAWYRDAIPIGQQAGDLQMLDRKWQEREPSIWQMPSMQKWGK